jgi:hypothetical protein
MPRSSSCPQSLPLALTLSVHGGLDSSARLRPICLRLQRGIESRIVWINTRY